MKSHEIEIEISKDGSVHAHIKGAKGKGCMAYAEMLRQIVGRIQQKQNTAEFYEPDEQVVIAPLIKSGQQR